MIFGDVFATCEQRQFIITLPLNFKIILNQAQVKRDSLFYPHQLNFKIIFKEPTLIFTCQRSMKRVPLTMHFQRRSLHSLRRTDGTKDVNFSLAIKKFLFAIFSRRVFVTYFNKRKVLDRLIESTFFILFQLQVIK